MKALILAAGRGERMLPLTATTPKPLLMVGSRTLIEHRIAALVAAGITEIVVNIAYLRDMIRQHLGDGKTLGANIIYSDEGDEPLETAGGIVQALPLLGTQAFVVTNADIWCDYPLHQLALAKNLLAQLVLVNNPSQHPQGDFGIEQNHASLKATPKFTFSGIALYHPDLFKSLAPGKRTLKSVLDTGIAQKIIGAEHYAGEWQDIGTIERLAKLNADLKKNLNTRL
ncbi:MAG: nucleotidyltransferase family protein [Gammaproteobacteria bacterium]|nr:nucleotidyltransferase family protein [Gammaproteobacteria bacterium]